MRKLESAGSLCGAIGLLFIAMTAAANPINYSFSGIATGTVGATAFTDAELTISASGDTSNVVALSPSIFCNNLAQVVVSIHGIGVATVTEPLVIFDSQGVLQLGLARASCTLTALDYFVISNSSFATYDLQTALPSVANDIPNSGTLGAVSTSLGALAFTTFGAPFTFRAGSQAISPTAISPIPMLEKPALFLLPAILALIAALSGPHGPNLSTGPRRRRWRAVRSRPVIDPLGRSPEST
jgi:hypothetical protein